MTAFDTAFSAPPLGPDDHRAPTVGLRILATTDLHLQLHGYDYNANTQGRHFGLAGLAPQIREARAEAQRKGMACLLFDNGDVLQGGALGAFLAAQPVTDKHPLVQALNTIGYDAIGVGAISILPRGTDQWNANVLSGHATVQDYHKIIHRAVPALRSAGADVIVLLAHLGSAEFHSETGANLAIASIPGIDAVVLGHTHETFPPSPSACDQNSPAGRIGGRPAIMPGHHGSHLGVLDITLQSGTDHRWRVCAHQAELRENKSAPCKNLLSASAQMHGLVRRHQEEPIGQLDHRVHNYFSFAAPTQTCALLAKAKRAAITDQLRGSANAELPLVVAVSAQTAGGRNGAENFVDIAPGPFLRRDLTALCPHDNEIWALRATGRDIRGWLEHAATVFRTLQPDKPDQMLLHPGTAPFHFLTMFGLHYAIDPAKPVGNRISKLRCDHGPLLASDAVVLVTDQFRAGGGGGYPAFDAQSVLVRHDVSLHSAVENMTSHDGLARDPWKRPWALKTSVPAKAILQTAPRAKPYLHEIAHLNPTECGISEEGFLQIRLSL